MKRYDSASSYAISLKVVSPHIPNIKKILNASTFQPVPQFRGYQCSPPHLVRAVLDEPSNRKAARPWSAKLRPVRATESGGTSIGREYLSGTKR